MRFDITTKRISYASQRIPPRASFTAATSPFLLWSSLLLLWKQPFVVLEACHVFRASSGFSDCLPYNVCIYFFVWQFSVHFPSALLSPPPLVMFVFFFFFFPLSHSPFYTLLLIRFSFYSSSFCSTSLAILVLPLPPSPRLLSLSCYMTFMHIYLS